MKTLIKRLFVALLLLLFASAYLDSAPRLLSHGATNIVQNAACDTALKYLYVREAKPNRGYEVDAFNESVGNARASPWCMAFVYFCYQRTYDYFKIKNPLLKTGRVATQLRYAAQFGSGMKVYKTDMIGKVCVGKGSIFCLKAGKFGDRDIGRDWNGHTGICIKDNGSTIETVEGNTNSAGGREGNRVALKNRNKSKLLAIVEIIR